MSHKIKELTTTGISTETEVCQIHGQVSRDLRYSRKPRKGNMWSGERLTKIQTTSRPDHIWPDAWTRIGKAAQIRKNQEWAIEKPKLDHARNLRRIYSIDPSDKNYKNKIKNARRKLETSTATGTTCKKESSKASIRKTVIPKTGKFKKCGANIEGSCVDDMNESIGQRIDFSTNRIQKGHNTG